MIDIDDFMRQAANRIATSSPSTSGVDGSMPLKAGQEYFIRAASRTAERPQPEQEPFTLLADIAPAKSSSR